MVALDSVVPAAFTIVGVPLSTATAGPPCTACAVVGVTMMLLVYTPIRSPAAIVTKLLNIDPNPQPGRHWCRHTASW